MIKQFQKKVLLESGLGGWTPIFELQLNEIFIVHWPRTGIDYTSSIVRFALDWCQK